MKTQDKQIGSYTYRVTQLGARKGQAVLLALARSALLPAAAGALGGLDAKALASLRGPDGRVNLATANVVVFAPALARVARELAERLDAPTFEFITTSFADATEVIGATGDAVKLSALYDQHFAGRYEDLAAWLYFSAEVNFGFFGRWVRSNDARPVAPPPPAQA